MATTLPDEDDGADDGYVVRPYDPGDADDVLALFESVWGTDRSDDWLAWHCEASPYVDGPSMVVADTGDEVVGARPYVPFPMRASGVDYTAVLLHNAMVHPDHRRRGLFTRMTERTVAAQADGGAAFLFNFARETSAPGYRKMAFRPVGTGPYKHLRIQSPGRFVGDRLSGALGTVAGGVADVGMEGYLSLRGRLRSPRPWHLSVDRRPGIDTATLTACYERDPPERLHTRREAPLYEWMADDPHWEYETYVARGGDGPVAAVLVRTERGGGDELRVVDAVPPGESETAALRMLLGAVVDEYRDAPSVAVTGPVVKQRLFPRSVLSTYGFVSTARPLLSRVTAGPDTMFVGSAGESFSLPGVGDLRDPDAWEVRVR